jgi:D-amino-acid dehydrogenase
MSDPWAAPGLPLKLLRWMGREQSPFLLRPGTLASSAMLSWGLQFLRNCSESHWRRNTEIIYRLCHYSQQATSELSTATGAAPGIVYDRSDKGTLRLFRDELSIVGAQRSADLVGELGCRYQVLDPAQCRELEPALAAAGTQFSGGIYFPDDASGDAHQFTRALAHCCEQLGVEFHYGVTVTALSGDGTRISELLTSQGPLTAAHYVLALGSASPLLARPLGIKLPIYPVKGYSTTVSVAGWNGAPSVPIVDDGRKMGITRLGDRLRLAGTAEFTGYDTQPNPRRNQLLLDSLSELFPGFSPHAGAEHWAGLRPMTPDGIPIIGATPYANLWLNTGQGHLGFTMACGCGRIVADLIAGREPDIDLSGMGYARASDRT